MKRSFFRKALCFLILTGLLMTQLVVFASASQSPEDDPADIFTDVPQNAWYRDAVRHVVRNGYFNGVTDTLFVPGGTMTRAMTVAVIWRMAGCPHAEGPIGFADVPSDQYYTEAVIWASQNGIVNGVSDTAFAPKQSVTRIQTAAMLYRYAAFCGAASDPDPGCTGGFPDESAVAAYGVVPMRWAVTCGIIDGREIRGLSWLQPGQNITRAEAAAMLMRYDEHVVSGSPVPQDTPEDGPEPDRLTTVWTDGVKTEQCPVWDELRYMGLEQAASVGGGTSSAAGNLRLSAFGHTLYLSKSGKEALIDGEYAVLSAPCRSSGGIWYVPFSELLSRFGYTFLDDQERNQCFYSRIPSNTAVPGGKRIVILRYHCVSDNVWGQESLFMSPAKLEEQISEMKRMGCSFLTFEDLAQVDQYELPVLLTFDDGYADNYTELLPILKRQNVRATVFMITKHVGRNYYLTADQLREMSQSGFVSIQSHTQTHADLTQVPDEQLAGECSGSRLDLARITGRIPFVLSYPKGMVDERVEAELRNWYQFGVLANTSPFLSGTNPYAVSRFGMPRDITPEQWKAYFN